VGKYGDENGLRKKYVVTRELKSFKFPLENLFFLRMFLIKNFDHARAGNLV
jgi:hypothetical protein